MSLTSEITQRQSLLYPGICNDVLKTFSPRLLPAGLTRFVKKSQFTTLDFNNVCGIIFPPLIKLSLMNRRMITSLQEGTETEGKRPI